MSQSTSSMTTPRPTADLVTSPTSLPHAPELPDWLPDESTLNRLAGEFFAALPGTAPTGPGVIGSLPTGSAPTAAGSPAPARAGEVEHAPRVDVPARSNSISRVPGDTGADPVAPVGGAPAGFPAIDLPGVQVADPVAALGVSPSRSVPDLTELASSVLGVHGLGAPLPEEPIVPGLTGLDLGAPGEFTPSGAGLTSPLPGAGAPGIPASDQLVGAGGLPNGPPDVTAAAPFTSGFGPPVASPESVGAVPFTPPGGFAVPSAPGGEMVPPLQGLSAPLPSAGVPGVPASDQILGSAGLPGGSPDITGAAPLGAAALAGPPFTAAEGASASAGNPPSAGAAPVSGAPFAPTGGLVAPVLPSVPEVPGMTGATGKLPTAAAGNAAPGTAAPTTGVATSGAALADAPPVVDPSVNPAGIVDAIPMPSLPQPPVPVPDAPAPVPTPSSPYYFIAESSPYRGAGDGGLDTLVGAALNPAQVAIPVAGPDRWCGRWIPGRLRPGNEWCCSGCTIRGGRRPSPRGIPGVLFPGPAGIDLDARIRTGRVVFGAGLRPASTVRCAVGAS